MKGEKGLAGAKGSKGNPGAAGAKGQRGSTGGIGPLGPRGIRYYISANLDSIVSASSNQVQKLKNMTAYKPPKWNFEAYFNYLSHKLGHYAKHGHRAGYYLDIQNSAYTSPYDFVESNANAVYIVYNIRNYPSLYTAGKKEINYLFSSGKAITFGAYAF